VRKNEQYFSKHSAATSTIFLFFLDKSVESSDVANKNILTMLKSEASLLIIYNSFINFICNPVKLSGGRTKRLDLECSKDIDQKNAHHKCAK
jgi:hypothetical protein